VPDELLGEELLTRRKLEQRDLVAQMVGKVACVDGDRLVILALLVLFAAAAGIESVEQDLFPVDLVVALLLFLLSFDFWAVLLLVLFLLEIDHLEEGVVQQLLLQMLLEVQERHVKQVHRLVKAWIDLQFLLELRALLETSFHCTSLPPLPSGGPKSPGSRPDDRPSSSEAEN